MCEWGSFKLHAIDNDVREALGGHPLTLCLLQAVHMQVLHVCWESCHCPAVQQAAKLQTCRRSLLQHARHSLNASSALLWGRNRSWRGCTPACSRNHGQCEGAKPAKRQALLLWQHAPAGACGQHAECWWGKAAQRPWPTTSLQQSSSRPWLCQAGSTFETAHISPDA